MKFFLAFALSILVGTFAVTKRFSGVAVKDDLPHIACDVCERSVELVFEEVAKARSTNKALNEMQITEIIEDLLSTVTERGEWMRRIDIIEATVKDKRYLSLVEPGGTSTCKNECASIAKSCQSLMNEEIDVDNLSTMLWKNKSSLSDVKAQVCTKWTSRCKPRRKELSPSYHRVDEEFEPLSEKALETERTLASMHAQGHTFYSNDEVMASKSEDDSAEL